MENTRQKRPPHVGWKRGKEKRRKNIQLPEIFAIVSGTLCIKNPTTKFEQSNWHSYEILKDIVRIIEVMFSFKIYTTKIFRSYLM